MLFFFFGIPVLCEKCGSCLEFELDAKEGESKKESRCMGREDSEDESSDLDSPRSYCYKIEFKCNTAISVNQLHCNIGQPSEAASLLPVIKMRDAMKYLQYSVFVLIVQ